MPETSPEDLKDCTVRISHEGGQNHDGSGFFVSPQLIVTCAHVCQKAGVKPIYIHWQGNPYLVRIKSCYNDVEITDLTLLELVDSQIQHPHVHLDDKPIAIGAKFFNFGYPDNYPQGDVGSFEYVGLDGRKLFKFKDGVVRPGLSGSPLLNLATKKVCGLVTTTLDRNQDLGGRGIPTKIIFEHFPEVKEFQQSFSKQENPFIPLNGKIEDINLVFDRELEIKRIFELLNSSSGVALIGESGSGKSSLLNLIKVQAATQLRSPRKPIYLDFGNIINDNDFYYGLCFQAGINCDYDHPIRGFRLKQELEKHRLLLLLDGLRKDMIWEGFTNAVRNQLRSLANTGSDAPLRLIVAADQPLTQLFNDSGADSPFENVCIEVKLEPWNETTIRHFIKHRLADTNIHFSESDIEEAIKNSQGNLQKLMVFCYETYKKYG